MTPKSFIGLEDGIFFIERFEMRVRGIRVLARRWRTSLMFHPFHYADFRAGRGFVFAENNLRVANIINKNRK